MMESFEEGDFQFLLEMVILSRNDNGATLYEIRDDFNKYFDLNLEATHGYNCWEQQIQPMLNNVMFNITSRTLDGGCVVYFMDIEAALSKSYGLSESMAYICTKLNIDFIKLREEHEVNLSKRSDSMDNSNPKSTSSRISTSEGGCQFYGHMLIGDNFFLEMSRIDLRNKLSRNRRPPQIGHCVSGLTIKKAIRRVSDVINVAHQNGAIINLGAVDLLQGRELLDMMKDMVDLCDLLCKKHIFPIVTTIPPLANQMHNKVLEEKRKAFNSYLIKGFDCIDIEPCFLSNVSNILFNLYRPEPQHVSGTNRPMVLWNHVGRQRVVKMLKRKIPEVYDEY